MCYYTVLLYNIFIYYSNNNYFNIRVRLEYFYYIILLVAYSFLLNKSRRLFIHHIVSLI